MPSIERFSRNGRKQKIRRARWPRGMHMQLKRNRFGRVDREAVMVYPPGTLGEEEMRQRMPVDPRWEFEDLEEVEEA